MAPPTPRSPGEPPVRKGPSSSDVVTLSYELADLPSAQHRAGLAGLVMMMQWLDTLPQADRKGTSRLDHLSRTGVSFTFDGPGLQWLFDGLYASDEEAREGARPRRKKNDEILPPLRELLEGESGNDGKVRPKKLHVYPAVVPRGAMLLALDPTRQGNTGVWIRLWRDFVWGVLRGIPAQREPFEARARNRPTRDGTDLHLALAHAPDASVPLPSTYHLGAQAKTAEGVLFRDRARWQLLLHFWPYSAQVYVPRALDPNDGTSTFDGFAVAIPDVASLDDFAARLATSLAHRSPDTLAYLPRAAVIDLPAEAALETATRLRRQSLGRASRGDDLVSAYDVFHLRKDGNNVRVLYSSRVDPTDLLDRYEAIRSTCSDPLFVRRRLTNLLEEQRLARLPPAARRGSSLPWYTGFDRDAATAPHHSSFFGSKWFRRDAHQAFIAATRADAVARREEEMDQGRPEPTSIDVLVLRMVRDHVRRRVKSKYGLDADTVRESPSRQKDLAEARERVARDTFLAVRARTDDDFTEYFAGTIASVPHRLPERDFTLLTSHLRDPKLRGDVRTLTLLALSAVAWAPSLEKRATDPKGDDP